MRAALGAPRSSSSPLPTCPGPSRSVKTQTPVPETPSLPAHPRPAQVGIPSHGPGGSSPEMGRASLLTAASFPPELGAITHSALRRESQGSLNSSASLDLGFLAFSGSKSEVSQGTEGSGVQSDPVLEPLIPTSWWVLLDSCPGPTGCQHVVCRLDRCPGVHGMRGAGVGGRWADLSPNAHVSRPASRCAPSGSLPVPGYPSARFCM